MRIQYITYSGAHKRFAGEGIFLSSFVNPRSFDEFDYNVIDLNSPYIWSNKGSSYQQIAFANDFKVLARLAEGSQVGKTVVVLPQDLNFRYHYLPNTAYKYSKNISLSRILPTLTNLIEPLLPIPVPIVPANGESRYGDEVFVNAFALGGDFPEGNILSRTALGDVTTVALGERFYVTGFLLENARDLFAFLQGLEGHTLAAVPVGAARQEAKALPAWLDEVPFFDDGIQLEIIRKAQAEIAQAEQVLAEHRQEKALLAADGERFFELVFDTFQKVTGIALNHITAMQKGKGFFDVYYQGEVYLVDVFSSESGFDSRMILVAKKHYQEYLKHHPKAKNFHIHRILLVNTQCHLPVKERKSPAIHLVQQAEEEGLTLVDSYNLLRLYEQVKSGGREQAEALEMLKAQGYLGFEL